MQVKRKPPPPTPCEVYKPDRKGNLKLAEVIPPKKPKLRKERPTKDVVYNRYRLVAVTDTGEEVAAGYAENMSQANKKIEAWFKEFPSHKEVLIYGI